MAGERVYHEHLSPLFNHIFNIIERSGAFEGRILQRQLDFGLGSLVKKRDGREET